MKIAPVITCVELDLDLLGQGNIEDVISRAVSQTQVAVNRALKESEVGCVVSIRYQNIFHEYTNPKFKRPQLVVRVDA